MTTNTANDGMLLYYMHATNYPSCKHAKSALPHMLLTVAVCLPTCDSAASCFDLLLLQAGQYVFSVTPPTILPGMAVLGSPMHVSIEAGPADVTRSSCNVAVPPQPVVGSAITARIVLADAYSNPVSAAAGGPNNNVRLTIYGGYGMHGCEQSCTKAVSTAGWLSDVCFSAVMLCNPVC